MNLTLGMKYKQTHKRSGGFIVTALARKAFGRAVYVEMQHSNGVTYWTLEATALRTLTPVVEC